MGSNKNVWTLEKMQKYCDENAPGYIVLDEKRIDKGYQKQQYALLQCPNKDHDPTWIWWNHFKHNRRCRYCKSERIRKSLSKDINDVINIFKEKGLNICDITEYKNVDTSIACIDKYGYKYFTNVTSLKKNNTQWKFSVNNPYSLENIKLYCKLNRNEYEIISDKYNGIKENYIWKYNGDFLDNKSHNRFFECSADSFINGNAQHPDINKSKLELEMIKILKELNIEFIQQKTFENCVYRIKMRFDFYFKINNIEYCVETDGEQHYRPVELWGGENSFKEIIERDKIKNTFCKENNIVLIRIPYNKINEAKDIIINTFKITDNKYYKDYLKLNNKNDNEE